MRDQTLRKHLRGLSWYFEHVASLDVVFEQR